MRILSRYVVVQFAMPFGVSLLAFAVVFVVIDLVDRLSAFIDREVGLGTILSYYLCYLPYIVVLVLPMAVLLAGLFCMGGLIQRGELLAMKSAGISLYQIVIPLQMLALGISLLAVAIADQVVPRANRARSKIEQPRQSAIGPQSIRVQVALRDTGRRVLSMVEYDATAMKGRQVVLDKHEGGSLTERVRRRRGGLGRLRMAFYERRSARIFRWKRILSPISRMGGKRCNTNTRRPRPRCRARRSDDVFRTDGFYPSQIAQRQPDASRICGASHAVGLSVCKLRYCPFWPAPGLSHATNGAPHSNWHVLAHLLCILRMYSTRARHGLERRAIPCLGRVGGKCNLWRNWDNHASHNAQIIANFGRVLNPLLRSITAFGGGNPVHPLILGILIHV